MLSQLFENSLMMEGTYHDEVMPFLFKATSQLPDKSHDLLIDWWMNYGPAELSPIVKCIHQYLTIHILLSAATHERYLINKDM